MPLLFEKKMITLMSVPCTQQFMMYIASAGQNHHFFLFLQVKLLRMGWSLIVFYYLVSSVMKEKQW